MQKDKNLFQGVMLNAYPDSIGDRLGDLISVLQKPELKDCFSFFYVLPTFFNSDLDRGFSIIDYQINTALVTPADLEALEALQIQLKFDIVLNHLSVASPQFEDLLKHGDASKYKDFFIHWNRFWEGEGTLGEDGVLQPKAEHLQKLFMRKSGLPILKVRFPDGSEPAYWNTFYQKVSYSPLNREDVANLEIPESDAAALLAAFNEHLIQHESPEGFSDTKNPLIAEKLIAVAYKKRSYLGQMDVNAKSPLVWEFYEATLKQLSAFGCKILRLDAFAYLHKEIGQSNFFNKPGTWDYLRRIKSIADRYNLLLLPEIHAEYGLGLHQEVAAEGYPIYDFFLPGLTLHTLEKASTSALKKWMAELLENNYQTVHMLGCHDGIPVLDLKGKAKENGFTEGLLSDTELQEVMDTVMQRGGRVKNLYDAEGNKISYYQINATFYSALGEDDQKMLLARALQLFMPGIPQIWYLDIFVGKNDIEAVEKGGKDSHKEINRSTLSLAQIEAGLKKPVVRQQLELIRLRNTSKAFSGQLIVQPTADHRLDLTWKKEDESLQLLIDLKKLEGHIVHTRATDVQTISLKC